MLSACKTGMQSKDAVRQGVLDYLASRPNLSMGGMNVDVTAVAFKDNEAEATVTFTPKGGPAGGGMTMHYTLEQKNNKWAVKSKADTGGNPHGAGQAMPGVGAANPHGAGQAMPGGAVDMERPGGAGMPPGHGAAGAPKGEKK